MVAAFARLRSLRRFYLPVPLSSERGAEPFALRDLREQAAALAAHGIGFRLLPRARVKRGGAVPLVDMDMRIADVIARKTDKVSVDWQLAWLHAKAAFVELFRLPAAAPPPLPAPAAAAPAAAAP